jgi:hypothetical protein
VGILSYNVFLYQALHHFISCRKTWPPVQHGIIVDAVTYILLSITNKMQRYTVFFITVKALHVSGGFSAHHQELKTVYTAFGICHACLLAATASGCSKQASKQELHIPDAVCTVLELLMMGGEAA